MEIILTQWNAMVGKCELATRFSRPHAIRNTSVFTNGKRCGGITLVFEEDVSIKYHAYLVIDKAGNLAMEYAYYTADTGITYLDKKRVTVTYGSAGIDTLDVDTGPLERALSKLKKYNPNVPVEIAMDVLCRQIRFILAQIEIGDEDLAIAN